MLSLTLQLLHFSSSFLTTINLYLYMLSLYRLCSTKQQKCNLLLKFQSNFRVDKVTYNIIILRSLLFMHYCLQLFFFNAMYHYPCLTICVHPLLPISPFRKVRSFPLAPYAFWEEKWHRIFKCFSSNLTWPARDVSSDDFLSRKDFSN